MTAELQDKLLERREAMRPGWRTPRAYPVDLSRPVKNWSSTG